MLRGWLCQIKSRCFCKDFANIERLCANCVALTDTAVEHSLLILRCAIRVQIYIFSRIVANKFPPQCVALFEIRKDVQHLTQISKTVSFFWYIFIFQGLMVTPIHSQALSSELGRVRARCDSRLPRQTRPRRSGRGGAAWRESALPRPSPPPARPRPAGQPGRTGDPQVSPTLHMLHISVSVSRIILLQENKCNRLCYFTITVLLKLLYLPRHNLWPNIFFNSDWVKLLKLSYFVS